MVNPTSVSCGGFGAIVLDEEDAVKQRRASRDVTPAVHVCERLVAVRLPQSLRAVRVPYQLGDRGRRGDRMTDGYRVDERSEDFVGARQGGGATREGLTEHDVLFAAVAG